MTATARWARPPYPAPRHRSPARRASIDRWARVPDGKAPGGLRWAATTPEGCRCPRRDPDPGGGRRTRGRARHRRRRVGRGRRAATGRGGAPGRGAGAGRLAGPGVVPGGLRDLGAGGRPAVVGVARRAPRPGRLPARPVGVRHGRRQLQRRGRWHRAVPGRLAAHAARRLPHPHRRRRRRRLAADVRRAGPLLRARRPAVRGVGPRRRPLLPARRGPASAAHAHRRGRPAGGPGPRPAGLALVAAPPRHRVGAVPGPPRLRATGDLRLGLQRGGQGVHGPHPLAGVPGPRRAPRHRRPRAAHPGGPGRAGLRRGVARRDRRGAPPGRRRRAVRGQRHRHAPAAAAIGLAAPPRRAGQLLGAGGPAADAAPHDPCRGLLPRVVGDLAGGQRRHGDEPAVLRQRPEPRLRAGRQVDPRSRPAVRWASPSSATAGAPTTTAPCASAWGAPPAGT